MDKRKRKRLEEAGWKIGSVQEFLGLTDEEATLIEIKLALANSVKSHRQEKGITQADLAKRLGSSQSRVAKIEAAESEVSVELMIKSLLALGASRREVGRAIGSKDT